MKTTSFLINILLLAFISIIPSGAFAQKAEKRASPPDSVSGKIGNAFVKINYSSPSVNGRKIWGGLVPYDKVWRTGANEATVFENSAPLKVEGKPLPAGKYAFFAIPGEKEWTIIFNKTWSQWGAFNYDEKQDILRVKVKPVKSGAMNEKLSYTVKPDGIALIWENIEVPVSMR